MKRLFLWTAFAAVAILLGLIIYIEVFSVPVQRFRAKLGDVVPAKLDGWEVRDMPLAQTEGMMEQVNKVLMFDDAVQRVYRKPGLEVIVYAAYWKPGKVTIADAGTHNPDSCWVLAGWRRQDRRYAQSTQAGTRALLPCEYGEYSINNHTSYVEFWHLVNGEPNRYEDQQTGWRTGFAGRFERLPLALRDMRKYGINMKREQLFLRISANRPFELFRTDPDYVRLMQSLEPLGIFADKPWR